MLRAERTDHECCARHQDEPLAPAEPLSRRRVRAEATPPRTPWRTNAARPGICAFELRSSDRAPLFAHAVFLRAGQLDGDKFRGQLALGPYIVDFICFAERLVVELDGPQHLEQDAVEYDARRTAWLVERGYRVLRFRNHEVDEDVRLVVDKIRQAIEVAIPTPLHPPSPALPSEGREPEGQK
jgi:very-short-patch-repair endonuclease